jgi:hypothetical protein
MWIVDRTISIVVHNIRRNKADRTVRQSRCCSDSCSAQRTCHCGRCRIELFCSLFLLSLFENTISNKKLIASHTCPTASACSRTDTRRSRSSCQNSLRRCVRVYINGKRQTKQTIFLGTFHALTYAITISRAKNTHTHTHTHNKTT